MNKMNKKGQQALEFFWTYGWAILVVFAAVSALAYFGVLSPERFIQVDTQSPENNACVIGYVGGLAYYDDFILETLEMNTKTDILITNQIYEDAEDFCNTYALQNDNDWSLE